MSVTRIKMEVPQITFQNYLLTEKLFALEQQEMMTQSAGMMAKRMLYFFLMSPLQMIL